MTFEKEFGNAGTWVRKHAKLLIVVLVAYMLVATPFGMTILGIVNPGFSGAEVACYGVDFKAPPGWTGTNTLYRVQDAQTGDLVQHSALGAGDHYTWGSGSGPEAMVLQHEYDSSGLTTTQQLATEVQTNIPLASFNYQNSTPLTLTNIPAWDSGEVLQYWNVQNTTTVTVLPNGTQITDTKYTATSDSLLLIPGNFYASIYIPPSKSNAGTDSGWQEGTWSQVDFWYAIYWYEWLNAYGPILQANEAPPNIPANALNRQSQFNLRGGFPIAGWIQGYETPIQTDTGTDYDLYTITARGNQQKTYAGNQLSASTEANILNQISLTPSLTGRQVVLYTQPGDTYSLPLYTLPTGNIDANAQGLMQSPDIQTILPAEYFKIGVNTFGTYADGSIWSGWTVYYPTVNYLLRFIFGVYGVHTYVWDVQTALNLGYNATANYQAPPAQWQNRTVLTASTAGPFSGLTDWFSNPWNLGQVWLIVAVIVILVISVTNPGWINKVLGRKKEE